MLPKNISTVLPASKRIRTAGSRTKGQKHGQRNIIEKPDDGVLDRARVIILAAVGYAAYRFACLECAPTGFLEFMVLGIVPAVYLAPKWLTLRSQPDSERR